MYIFEIGNRVSIKESGETGLVIGRAEYAYCEQSYFIRYKQSNGVACESWWTESALELAEK